MLTSKLNLKREAGFLIVERRRFRFTNETAELFYNEHRGKKFFSDLVDYITSGDVVALCLAREDGVRKWRELLGPTRYAPVYIYNFTTTN